jgi:hypothetical protein
MGDRLPFRRKLAEAVIYDKIQELSGTDAAQANSDCDKLWSDVVRMSPGHIGHKYWSLEKFSARRFQIFRLFVKRSIEGKGEIGSQGRPRIV